MSCSNRSPANSCASIAKVVNHQLCAGCGACASVQPARFSMRTIESYGRRPAIRRSSPAAETQGLNVCPGRSLERPTPSPSSQANASLYAEWGPVLGVWEGHATDPEIRRAGSSGGATTALSLFCLERGGAFGVLHARPDEHQPLENRTVMSRNRDDLLAGTGSRYAPASPCEGLGMIQDADGPCVFVGKPCDAAAVSAARRQDAQLDSNLTLVIAFFCAGTPSTEGVHRLIESLGIGHSDRVESVRYRGNGWPGDFVVTAVNAQGKHFSRSASYEASWGYLQKYRQWRCYICPDHSGEFADIATGDPWYRAPQSGEAGRSLIVARTARGLEIVQAAAEAGYIEISERRDDLLPGSQPNLAETRKTLAGRLLAMRLLSAPTPDYQGFELQRSWRELSLWQRLRVIGGTLRRVFRRRLRHSLNIMNEA